MGLFECLICMCFVFLYLHLFSAAEHASHGKYFRNTLIIMTIIIIFIFIFIFIIIIIVVVVVVVVVVMEVDVRSKIASYYGDVPTSKGEQ